MKKIKNYKLTIICFILIMIAILMPGKDVPASTIPNLDKVVHFCMFGCITACYTFEYYKEKHRLANFLSTVCIFFVFAVITEILQIFVPLRSCDIKDVVADFTGILLIGYIVRSIVNKIEYK